MCGLRLPPLKTSQKTSSGKSGVCGSAASILYPHTCSASYSAATAAADVVVAGRPQHLHLRLQMPPPLVSCHGLKYVAAVEKQSPVLFFSALQNVRFLSRLQPFAFSTARAKRIPTRLSRCRQRRHPCRRRQVLLQPSGSLVFW